MANECNQVCLEMTDGLSEKMKTRPRFVNATKSSIKYVETNNGKEHTHCLLWNNASDHLVDILRDLLFSAGRSFEYIMFVIEDDKTMTRHGYLHNNKIKMTLSI